MDLPDLKYGICIQTLIPVRFEASEASELVTQILFGEIYFLQEINDKWARIKLEYDAYEGWIDAKLLKYISQETYDRLKNGPKYYSEEPLSELIILKDGSFMPLVAGSILYNCDKEGLFKIDNHQFKFVKDTSNKNKLKLIQIASKFLNAPYLWGGKTLLGIDCSGFTQVVYKLFGVLLPRDASQQISIGTNVSFIEEANEGDLAFFDNEDGNIVHVGILLNNHEIIHASGCVRIDAIDHQGIYNRDLKKYTHKLRMIKRVI